MKKTEERQGELKDRLREAMEKRGVKAVTLCEITGIPKGAISYYLAGKSQPKADRVHLLGKALNVSEAWLMGFDVPMERSAEQKKNDDLVQVIAKLRKDPDFFEVVSTLADLREDEYESVKQLLGVLRSRK